MADQSSRSGKFQPVGMRMRNFGRTLIRNYVASSNLPTPGELSPSWQSNAEQPLVWRKAESAPANPPEEAVEETPKQSGGIDPMLLRLLEAHKAREAAEAQRKAELEAERPPPVEPSADSDSPPPRRRRGAIIEVTPQIQAAREPETSDFAEADDWPEDESGEAPASGASEAEVYDDSPPDHEPDRPENRSVAAPPEASVVQRRSRKKQTPPVQRQAATGASDQRVQPSKRASTGNISRRSQARSHAADEGASVSRQTGGDETPSYEENSPAPVSPLARPAQPVLPATPDEVQRITMTPEPPDDAPTSRPSVSHPAPHPAPPSWTPPAAPSPEPTFAPADVPDDFETPAASPPASPSRQPTQPAFGGDAAAPTTASSESIQRAPATPEAPAARKSRLPRLPSILRRKTETPSPPPPEPSSTAEPVSEVQRQADDRVDAPDRSEPESASSRPDSIEPPAAESAAPDVSRRTTRSKPVQRSAEPSAESAAPKPASIRRRADAARPERSETPEIAPSDRPIPASRKSDIQRARSPSRQESEPADTVPTSSSIPDETDSSPAPARFSQAPIQRKSEAQSPAAPNDSPAPPSERPGVQRQTEKRPLPISRSYRGRTAARRSAFDEPEAPSDDPESTSSAPSRPDVVQPTSSPSERETSVQRSESRGQGPSENRPLRISRSYRSQRAAQRREFDQPPSESPAEYPESPASAPSRPDVVQRSETRGQGQTENRPLRISRSYRGRTAAQRREFDQPPSESPVNDWESTSSSSDLPNAPSPPDVIQGAAAASESQSPAPTPARRARRIQRAAEPITTPPEEQSQAETPAAAASFETDTADSSYADAPLPTSPRKGLLSRLVSRPLGVIRRTPAPAPPVEPAWTGDSPEAETPGWPAMSAESFDPSQFMPSPVPAAAAETPFSSRRAPLSGQVQRIPRQPGSPMPPDDESFVGESYSATDPVESKPDLFEALLNAGMIRPTGQPGGLSPQSSRPDMARKADPTASRRPGFKAVENLDASVAEAGSPEAGLLDLLRLPPSTPIIGLKRSPSAQNPTPPAPAKPVPPPAPPSGNSPPQNIGRVPPPEPVVQRAVGVVNQFEDPTVESSGIDVEKLAQDVYQVLRNRLRIERERRHRP